MSAGPDVTSPPSLPAGATPGASAVIVKNPATGATLATLAPSAPSEVAAAVARARVAQRAWQSTPLAARSAQLQAFARRLRDDATLIDTLVAESGKPVHEAVGIELWYTLEVLRGYTTRKARRALEPETRIPSLFMHKRARVLRHPRGVVGVIGPWNWPLLNNFADCLAPLLAGNAVVLKPSEHTPLTSLRVQALWKEAGLPADVFQVVVGRGDVGEALVDTADMIFFTGSQRTGRRIGARCGERLVPCVLELGGKSAMIVLEDADLEAAARGAVWSAFAHSGQVCVRTERVLVDERVADRFLELVRRNVEALRQGPSTPLDDGRAPELDVGAMTFAPQIEVAESQIADALAKGARVLIGGDRRRDLPGQFFRPTVLADCNPTMKVMREETFGPVLPVMRIRDDEEALRIANESDVGLTGSVWSRDERRARDLAARLETGSVCVNDVLVNYFCVEAPLGGVKASGLGFRHGPEALQQFCRTETVVEPRPVLRWIGPSISRRITFPYRRSFLALIRWVLRQRY
jgi:acyl-CoA reductase-like NAD-dependent aldehyde dehydrogenase